ncbi:hypothetical protein [Acidocella facilis]|uniref:hypothetical protein n=1 Tax=Acidocella facilis TaxID=525 RepID=UPI001F30B12A|nr:hypothetical protein [Acidocella facilis]
MARFVKFCFVAALAYATFAPASAATADQGWISIEHLSAFSDVQAQLQTLVNINGRKKMNHFCVVGHKDGDEVQAYVYWSTEEKLILWVPHLYDDEALVTSDRYLDLKRDVVDGNDVHGSTYMVTRAFVNKTLQACRNYGETFEIKKSN